MRWGVGSLPMVVSQNFSSATSLAMLAPMRTLISIPSFSWMMSEISLSPSGPSSTPWETSRDRVEHLPRSRHPLCCDAPAHPNNPQCSAAPAPPRALIPAHPHVLHQYSPKSPQNFAPASHSPHNPGAPFLPQTPGFPLQPLQAGLLPVKSPQPSVPPAHTLMSDTPIASFFTWPLSWSQTLPMN